MKYKHLNENDRYMIDILFNQEKRSISQIGRILKKNKSTISRELKRNLNNFSSYEFKITE